LTRTAIARGTSSLVRAGLTQASSKRRVAYEDDLDAIRSHVYERSRGACESWEFVKQNKSADDATLYWSTMMPVNCLMHRPSHIHHRKYRSRGGSNDLVNLLYVCQPCHQFIHEHGGIDQVASVLGFALHSWEDEAL
jgi:5-methylcytosine-specific restriction endonuclease McrA